jgi:hypothetical protein
MASLALQRARWLILGVAAALGGVGCATAPAPRTTPPADASGPAASAAPAAGRAESGPFEQLKKREASGLKAWTLQFPGSTLSGTVVATAPPVVQHGSESWSIDVPVGSTIPVACVVFPRMIDGAATMLRFIRTAREGAKGITIRSIVPTDVGAIDETAYMIATLSYTKPTEKGLLGGEVKMMIRPDADASLFCFQDEVGYTATFKQVAMTLAHNLKSSQPHPRPDYVEIHVMHFGDIPVGFDRRTIASDGQGAKIDWSVSCELVPRSPEDVMTTDRVHVERSDGSGRLVQVDSVEAEGEEVSSQYHLIRRGARDYFFEGKQSGKPVSGTFKSKEKEGLPSALLVATRLRAALLVGKAAEIKVEEYHPTLAPRPLEVIYRRGSEASGVTMQLGQLLANGRLDERGMVTDFSMPIAGSTMREQRVLVRGAP